MKKQSGFTLIELAIVLVIIGLLLGGVLKGQELINSARVKNMAADFKNVQVFIYGYQDRFRALPGDDARVDAHLGNVLCAVTCLPANGTHGNGLIDGQWNDPANADTEAARFWEHVRKAGFAPGPQNVGDQNYIPQNADGGNIGVQSVGAVGNFTKITGMTGAYAVCSDAILGRFAIQLDITLDDGETDRGSVRATPVATTNQPATATANINPNTTYTVCMTF